MTTPSWLNEFVGKAVPNFVFPFVFHFYKWQFIVNKRAKV